MPPRKRSSNPRNLDEEPAAKKPRKAASNKQQADIAPDGESDHDLSQNPTRIVSPWKFGPHVSAAGGVENAVVNAASIGATAFALFLKSQRQWTSKDLSESSVEKFKRRMSVLGYDGKYVLPHGSYLVNLGNPDVEKREKSYRCFLDDLKRCEQLGLLLYNFHPGSTVGQTTKEESLSYVAQCINRAHKETESVVIVIENMAGAGNVLGSKFSEIGAIIREVEDKTRVGVCLDTCHMFAAGYDIRTQDGWDSMMSEFTQEIGLEYLRGMHINDSKGSVGSGKDRHQNLGLGHLTLRTFSYVLSDPRTKDIPLILETPAHDSDKAKGKSAKKTKKHEDSSVDASPSSTEWEVWKKEVEVLGRLAALGEKNEGFTPTSPNSKDGEVRDRLLEEWTKEVKAVVVKYGGSAALANEVSKGDAKGKTKGKGQRRNKKAVSDDEESDESC